MKKAFYILLALMLCVTAYSISFAQESSNAFGDDTTVTSVKSATVEEIARISQETAAKEDTVSLSGKGVIRVNALYVRAEPWGTILGTVQEKDIVTITGTKGDWYQINYNGQTAYCHSKWVVVAGQTRSVPDNGTVISSGNVRLSTDSNDVVEILAAGTDLQILGESGDYWKIKYNGYEAYVAKSEVNAGSRPDVSAYASLLGNNSKPSSEATSSSSNTTSTTGSSNNSGNNSTDVAATEDSNVATVNTNDAVTVVDGDQRQTGVFDIANKTGLVGICYSTWFDPVIDGYGSSEPLVIQDCLDGKKSFGPINQFHYWGKPYLGFYKSTNKTVIQQHMTMLYEAGIDFIVLDNTNVSMTWQNGTYWTEMVDKPGKALLDTIVEMRAGGQHTPYVVNWIGGDENCLNSIFNKFYKDSKYKECWVYWGGKPFIITTNNYTPSRSDITTRKMWGLQGSGQPKSEWSFLNYPNNIAYDANGKAEQTCVCVALQRNYMSNTSSAVGRRGGKTFHDTWATAFSNKPKVVTITWWNEWCAQRFEGNAFVDNYTMEYSRDIEPMTGGHGDKYYKWMCKYIEAYKTGKACPNLVD